MPQGDWFTWMLLSGRGFGKTRVGSETVIQWAYEGYSPIALVGQTKADVRDTMVELGDSSILKVAPPWFYPEYEPSKRRLTFPNGSICIIYSGDEPDQLRGPQHQKAWVDELAKFKKAQETWDNLEFGLRLGDNPQVVCTTTPRPIRLIKEIVTDKRTIITKGNTLENKSNLNPRFLSRMIEKYSGTRLGRQELNGDILDDNPNALWKMSWIDEARVTEYPSLDRIVVGVDPAVTSNPKSADTGIIVAGLKKHGPPDKITGRPVPHYYVLGDYTLHGTPFQWATEAVSAFRKHAADNIIGEVNNGGDLVKSNVQSIDPNIPFKDVHASRGKAIRAEPVSNLYEQGRVHHIGYFPLLEEEQTDWVPEESDFSPNRIDAEVWAIWHLINASMEPEYGYETDYTGTSFSSGGMRI